MTTAYQAAGLSMAVTCTDPSVAGAIDARLGAMRSSPGVPPDLVVTIDGPHGIDGQAALEMPTSVGRPIYDLPEGTVFYHDDCGVLSFDLPGRVRLRCQPAHGRIAFAILSGDPFDASMVTHHLLTVALHETMKRFDRLPLHAAALALGRRGVLIPGTSGAGKSTLTLSLVRSGFEFLSDDTVFMSESAEPDGERPAAPWVSAFPDEVNVTAGTAAMIPELSQWTLAPLPPGRTKHSLRVEDALGVLPLEGCTPVAMIFPRLEDGPAPYARPLTAAQALLELTPNVLLTDPRATQSHFDMLGRLARSVPSYQFRPGIDLDAAAAYVAELVSS